MASTETGPATKFGIRSEGQIFPVIVPEYFIVGVIVVVVVVMMIIVFPNMPIMIHPFFLVVVMLLPLPHYRRMHSNKSDHGQRGKGLS